MNIVIDRQLVAQIMIMLAICIGGWMLIVEPKLAPRRAVGTLVVHAPMPRGAAQPRRIENWDGGRIELELRK